MAPIDQFPACENATLNDAEAQPAVNEETSLLPTAKENRHDVAKIVAVNFAMLMAGMNGK